jgi:hypothetical protein
MVLVINLLLITIVEARCESYFLKSLVSLNPANADTQNESFDSSSKSRLNLATMIRSAVAFKSIYSSICPLKSAE